MSKQEYHGGCHCGAVTYKINTELGEALQCNCSICSKGGSLLHALDPEDFTLLSGEDNLSDYQFNKKSIHHLFCKTCGIKSFARGEMPDGTKMIAVSLRCLEGVDAESMPKMFFDGASL
jgi:hypothetical protein